MHALTQLVSAHPFASAWVALAIWLWIEIYARTGGVRRRKAARFRIRSGRA
ncbi:hypothetical protein ACNHKD_07915 [Methylocystis sp. JAN1]|uniref:hypothetical protein n=1 Tax=Methylocystis sp. JAN1 TaxID=3397211 RepID=UPI003FA2432C